MTKTIEYIGEEVEISEYKVENYFDNQKEWVAEQIPLNPNLRADFDVTPNDERDDLEISHWWGKPYIVAQFVTLTDRNYLAFVKRLESYGSTNIVSEKEWNEQNSGLNIKNEDCTHGVTFIVRCLDGGAWDRSTWKGQYNNLADAILCAESLIQCNNENSY